MPLNKETKKSYVICIFFGTMNMSHGQFNDEKHFKEQAIGGVNAKIIYVP